MKLKKCIIIIIGIVSIAIVSPIFGQIENNGNDIAQIDTLHQTHEMNIAIDLEAIIYVLLLLVLANVLFFSVTKLNEKQFIPVLSAKRIKVLIILVALILIDIKILNLIVTFNFTGQIILTASILFVVVFGYGWIKDFLSWVYLSIIPTVCEGTRVEIGGRSGLVVKMNILYTTLLTVDGKEIWIPNRQFMEVGFLVKKINVVRVKFFIPADADIKKVQELLIEAAKVSPYIDLDYETQVSFSQIIMDYHPWLQVELRVCADDMDNEDFLKNDLEYRIQKELYVQKILTNK